jgi:hypothetical protein
MEHLRIFPPPASRRRLAEYRHPAMWVPRVENREVKLKPLAVVEKSLESPR